MNRGVVRDRLRHGGIAQDSRVGQGVGAARKSLGRYRNFLAVKLVNGILVGPVRHRRAMAVEGEASPGPASVVV